MRQTPREESFSYSTCVPTQPDPSFDKEFYPSDLAVREVESGVFELVVTVTEPEPRVDRYRWRLPER